MTDNKRSSNVLTDSCRGRRTIILSKMAPPHHFSVQSSCGPRALLSGLCPRVRPTLPGASPSKRHRKQGDLTETQGVLGLPSRTDHTRVGI